MIQLGVGCIYNKIVVTSHFEAIVNIIKSNSQLFSKATDFVEYSSLSHEACCSYCA